MASNTTIAIKFKTRNTPLEYSSFYVSKACLYTWLGSKCTRSVFDAYIHSLRCPPRERAISEQVLTTLGRGCVRLCCDWRDTGFWTRLTRITGQWDIVCCRMYEHHKYIYISIYDYSHRTFICLMRSWVALWLITGRPEIYLSGLLK